MQAERAAAAAAANRPRNQLSQRLEIKFTINEDGEIERGFAFKKHVDAVDRIGTPIGKIAEVVVPIPAEQKACLPWKSLSRSRCTENRRSKADADKVVAAHQKFKMKVAPVDPAEKNLPLAEQIAKRQQGPFNHVDEERKLQ